MILRYKTYFLEFIHPFRIAINTRTQTPIILLELESNGIIGYGEASLPPYLFETQESVIHFFKKVDGDYLDTLSSMDLMLDYIFQLEPGNMAAKAALDIALHDLWAKKSHQTLYSFLGINPSNMRPSSFTLGMDDLKLLPLKLEEAESFKILKVKLGGYNDLEIIKSIRNHSDKPLYIDANQGWTDKELALERIHWLADQGVILIEQPMPKKRELDQAWLLKRSPIPILADEDCQTYEDISQLLGRYTGINIKLMKCGGLREAFKMIKLARELNLEIMMGCMNESSCAIMAGAVPACLVDYIDLDGPFLINNNPFQNPRIKEGIIQFNDSPGLGLEPI